MNKTQEDILVYAMRYALGRKTSAVGTVSGEIFNNWNEISSPTRAQIQKEIKVAVERNEAGPQCYVDEWRQILALSPEVQPAFFGSISIDYDEGEPATYRSVHAHTRDFYGAFLEEKDFASGDANVDYNLALMYLHRSGCVRISCSSSVDHFMMDGGNLVWDFSFLEYGC